jgi:cytochrome c oxidase cbb3-type subunit 4
MDINFLRVAVTVLSFTLFIGIVVWAWSRNRRFDDAARLPFVESQQSSAAAVGESRHG